MKTFLTLALSLCIVQAPTDDAHASHPAPFPHAHTPKKVAPRPARHHRPARHRLRHGGVYAGLNVGGSFLFSGKESSLGEVAPGGAMLEVISGLQLNPWVAVEITGLAAFHSDEDPSKDVALIVGGCLNAKVYLSQSSESFAPYVLAGVGLYASARGDEDEGAGGVGVQGGVGFDLRLNPYVTVGADATFRGALWEKSLEKYFQSFITLTGGIRLSL